MHRLYTAVDKGEKFKFDADWRVTGRPALIPNSRLKECAAKLADSHGRKDMKTKVNDILIEEERRNGLLPEFGKTTNLTTLNNLAIFTDVDDRLTIAGQQYCRDKQPLHIREFAT